MSQACDECGKHFSKVASLNNHKAVVHLKTKSYACDQCEKTFTNGSNLKTHRDSVHKKLMKYECKSCGKQFPSKDRFENHLRTHTGDKPFVCEVCSTCFSDLSALSNHRTIHLENKPSFNCGVCGKKFTRKRAVTTHMLSHNTQSGTVGTKRIWTDDVKLEAVQLASKYGAMRAADILAIPFSSIRRWSSQCKNGLNVSCEICGKSFQFNSALNRHIDIVHKENEAEKHKSHERSHTYVFKEEVAQFATENTSTVASAKYNVAEATVRRWVNLMKKSIRCSSCKIDFAYETELVKHNKKRHGLVDKKMYSNFENIQPNLGSLRDLFKISQESLQHDIGNIKLLDNKNANSEVLKDEPSEQHVQKKSVDEVNLNHEHEQDESIDLKDIENPAEEIVMNLFEEVLSHEERNATIGHSIDDIFKVTEQTEYSIESEDQCHDKHKDNAASVNPRQDDGEISIINEQEEINLKDIQKTVSFNNTEATKNEIDDTGNCGKVENEYNILETRDHNTEGGELCNLKKENEEESDDDNQHMNSRNNTEESENMEITQIKMEGSEQTQETKHIVYNRKGLKIVFKSKYLKEKNDDEVSKATDVEFDCLKQLNNDCVYKAVVVKSVGSEEEDNDSKSMASDISEITLEPTEDLAVSSKYEDDAKGATSKKKKRNEDELTCKFCGKIFNVLYYLDRHIVKHTGVKHFQCTLCPNQFSHKPSLLRHIKLHTGEKPFMCLLCGNTFAQSGSLKKHERTHQPDKAKKQRQKVSRDERKDGSYICEKCGKDFQSNIAMRRHVMALHEKDFHNVCPNCGKGFLSCHKQRFLIHTEKCNTADFTATASAKDCNQCDKSFTKMSNFKRHLKHHSKSKEYSCFNCGKTFADKRNLIIHTNRLHPEDMSQFD